MGDTMEQTDDNGKDAVRGEKILQPPSSNLPAVAGGGQGEIIKSLRADHHKRGDGSMIRQAIDNGWISFWEIPKDMMEDLPRILTEHIRRATKAGDMRTVKGLSNTLRALLDSNLKTAELVDRTDRLDAGRPTEAIELQPVIFPGMTKPLTAKRDDGSNREK